MGKQGFPSSTQGTVLFGGSIAQRPGVGGLTWVFLQYVLGFQRLGWDVIFLDRLEPDMCVDSAGERTKLEDSINLSYFRSVMARYGLNDSHSLSYDRGKQWIGLPRDEVLRRARESSFLMNVMGFIDDADVMGAARSRVFLDIDPGFGQMWRELGWHDLFRGYDKFVTVGLNVGSTRSTVPTCGLTWIPTPPPVVLDYWPEATESPGGAFTSVVAWRGPFDAIEYRGIKYGLRVHEFRRFVRLPQLTGQRFELALDIHQDDARDAELLLTHGWSLVDPFRVAGYPWSYQIYIRQSAAEIMIAKGLYVQTNSGWLSYRTVCYLATGKPAIVQDTGLGHLYPTGTGFITFNTLEEACAGVLDIGERYPQHSAAARELAEEYFHSDKVLGRLLECLDAT